MTEFVMIHDLKEANGKTIKENNLERVHQIPLGSLVEITSKYSTDFRWTGCRLFVLGHSRDCDGTPLYNLGPKDDANRFEIHGGFGEDNLILISGQSSER